MKLVILKLARNDLKEIHEYLSEFGESPNRKFRASFEEFCIQIVNTPYMFNKYEHNPNFRKAAIIFEYLVFYQVDDKTKKVKIYRVLHGKQDIRSML
ncbi:MAG: type II toxin-antitoxin system RelE/ParE family toxin [Lachnospiraceae bacterium]|nr:type II toxin-antitoxin system RelE/ParE family toxin [Lachnospiraceae bacterium]